MADLAAVAALVVLGLSAVLLSTLFGHRRAGVLLALGVVGTGVSHLQEATFEPWGYAGMVGHALHWSAVGFILPVLLTFPGRTLDPLGRALVTVAWGLVLVRAARVLSWDPDWMDYDGPARWWTLPGLESPATSETLRGLEWIWLGLLVVGCVVAFVRRWRSVRGLARVPVRVLAVTGIALSFAVPLNGLGDLLSERLSTVAYVVQNVLLLSVPLGLLVVTVWSAMNRGMLVERLTARAGDAPGVQRTLAGELDDPDLRVWFRRPRGWLDVDGRDVQAPPGPRTTPPYEAGPGRHWEILRRGGVEPDGADVLAAVDLADEAMGDPGRVRVALGAAALVLDNTRLAVEREVHLAQLREAQARMVAAALQERRRMERDLHDGAQQQLLRVSTTLSRARLATEPDEARAVVDEARGQLAGALSELRNLVHGIHPAALSQGGLATALEQLARLDPRVDLELDPELREGPPPGPALETAAYFVVAEAVANAVKHSRASGIRVSARRQHHPEGLRLVVVDDGVGGATPAGRGLRGITDRVSALGGTLDLASPPGQGTCLDAWLPT